MRSGVRLAIDVGTVRVGVARSDHDGILALPVETVPREGARDRVRELIRQFQPIEVIIGLPISLSGRETASTADARAFAGELGGAIAGEPGIPIRVVDERLTTVSAQQALRSSGRSSKASRSRIDQVAAVILLQHCLESERASGNPPGQVL